MDAQKPPFEQRDHAVSAWEQVLLFRLMQLYLAVMDVAIQSQIGVPAIGSNRAARRNRLPNKAVQTGFGDIRDGAQTDAADAVAVFLGGNEDARLQRCFPHSCTNQYLSEAVTSTSEAGSSI